MSTRTAAPELSQAGVERNRPVSSFSRVTDLNVREDGLMNPFIPSGWYLQVNAGAHLQGGVGKLVQL